MSIDIRQGECREVLARLPAQSAHCVITSPPYFGLRNYNGGAQEIGAESTPAEYVAHLVEVFRAVWRVLRDDGTCWIVIGDSFASSSTYNTTDSLHTAHGWKQDSAHRPNVRASGSVPAKNLLMIPHRVALALQEDGWIVRNDCVWAKGSAMPESVQDRFSRAHEFVFHLAKSERYYFDPIAVAEPATTAAPRFSWQQRRDRGEALRRGDPSVSGPQRSSGGVGGEGCTRNRRSVLHINPQPFSAAAFGVKDVDHYAVFPEKLVEILTLCSTSEAGACPRCGAPYRRVVERSQSLLDATRPQARRATELAARAGLTDAHIKAIQATGITDTGKALQTQNGAGHNAPDVQALADEAKRALGGYYREYLLAPRTSMGWQAGCTCDAGPPLGCTVLDPFLGSGTVALVSKRLGRSCVGIELNPAYCDLARRRVESVPYTLFSAASSTTGAAR